MIFQSALHFHKTADGVAHTHLKWENAESFVIYLVKQDTCSTKAKLLISTNEWVLLILKKTTLGRGNGSLLHRHLFHIFFNRVRVYSHTRARLE